jgi:hypothetical protein
MAWMRTREIKPGVYETQSAGFHALKQVGIALGVLCTLVLAGMAIHALFFGDSDDVFVVLFFGVPLGLIAAWHVRYHRRNPPEPRRPGPWD